MNSDNSNSIESVLQEQRVFPPSDEFSSKSRISSFSKYLEMSDMAKSDPNKFWGDAAREELHWFKPFDKVLDWSKPPFARWFDGGKTNISYNSTHFQQESPTKMIYKDVETLLFFNDFRSESRYFVGNAENLFQKRGIGFGLDLGYSIYKKKSDVKDNHSYLYKIGVSVLDLGFLSFNKLSEVHVYEIIGPRELDIGEVKNYKDMSERVYGDRNKSFKKNNR